MTRLSGSGVRLSVVAAVGLALLLSVLGVPITSAQGTTMFPVRADGPLPADAPFDPAWDAVSPADVALSGQAVVPPMAMLPAFPSVRVRSLYNADAIAVMIEWTDPTADTSVSAVGRFSDAAAMQFAQGMGTSICMGQQAGGLNIWQWKADWAADLAGRQDVEDVYPNMPVDEHFPPGPAGDALTAEGFLTGQMAGNPRSAATHRSSVEDLNAIGFGTLTPQPAAQQDVHGASQYRDGTWRVVMSRTLTDADPNDAQLRPGVAAVVAFAIWDGSRGDRDGQKSVSTWLTLSMAEPPIGFFQAWPFLVMIVMALGMAGLIIAIGARQPAGGSGIPQPEPDAES